MQLYLYIYIYNSDCKYLPFRYTYYIRLDVLQHLVVILWIYRGLYDVLMLQWQTKLIAALG